MNGMLYIIGKWIFEVLNNYILKNTVSNFNWYGKLNDNLSSPFKFYILYNIID